MNALMPYSEILAEITRRAAALKVRGESADDDRLELLIDALGYGVEPNDAADAIRRGWGVTA
jgi:hypothetical protein